MLFLRPTTLPTKMERRIQRTRVSSIHTLRVRHGWDERMPITGTLVIWRRAPTERIRSPRRLSALSIPLMPRNTKQSLPGALVAERDVGEGGGECDEASLARWWRRAPK